MIAKSGSRHWASRILCSVIKSEHWAELFMVTKFRGSTQVEGPSHGVRTVGADPLLPFEPRGRVVSHALIYGAMGSVADQFNLRFSNL